MEYLLGESGVTSGLTVISLISAQFTGKVADNLLV